MPNSSLLTRFELPVWLTPHHLHGMQRGIEKESLRMQANGYLAQTGHPQALGAALTHPYITTDYSEALLELITPPSAHPAQALDFLRKLHMVVQQNLPEGETLWPMSMPCMLDNDENNIPLARYGSSHLGRFKTLYRHGLGVRYGRRMQTIAGVHYNISFADQLFVDWQQQAETPHTLRQLSLQDYRSERYFGLIRNFLRLSPLVIYLLGASPSVCACFLTNRQHHLQPLTAGTLYLPEATALRMGRLGYQNSAQRQLGIHYNSLTGYLEGIQQAIRTPYPPFSQLGLDDANGQPIQINDHILQIENEYYSPIRPKQIPQSDETPAQALQQRGVAYIELRAVDINPYSDIGIDLTTACFLEIAALYSLLQDSPAIEADEQACIDTNLARVVDQGRKVNLTLSTLEGEQLFKPWARAQLEQMQAVASILDEAAGDTIYQKALQVMGKRLEHIEQTLSAQVLSDTVAAGSSWSFGQKLAKQYAAQQTQPPLDEETRQYFVQVAQQSRQAQQQLEQQDQADFNTYLASYRQQKTLLTNPLKEQV
ncbi:glutamate--cysteine ligase [Alkanindiges sp. WGS2144]|uniref:glutamate--cysteine ligase n=1 Tax=Alkanindiges sp. WGS2144 TaxID=3366808 RepID=UPI00375061B2